MLNSAHCFCSSKFWVSYAFLALCFFTISVSTQRYQSTSFCLTMVESCEKFAPSFVLFITSLQSWIIFLCLVNLANIMKPFVAFLHTGGYKKVLLHNGKQTCQYFFAIFCSVLSTRSLCNKSVLFAMLH